MDLDFRVFVPLASEMNACLGYYKLRCRNPLLRLLNGRIRCALYLAKQNLTNHNAGQCLVSDSRGIGKKDSRARQSSRGQLKREQDCYLFLQGSDLSKHFEAERSKRTT